MKLRVILAVTAFAVGVPVFAHHSFAMFDMNKDVTLQGTVAAFKWSNPHAWIELTVPGANAQTARWSVEMTSPNNLVRQGWKRTTFKAGDKTTIVVHPLRDGKTGGSLVSAVAPDGKVLGSASGQTGATDK